MSKDLSIIIPVFNANKYLSKALKSVCKQINKKNRDRVEIILIDDYSKDDSKNICLNFKKRFNFIKFLRNKKNFGVSKTRNIGIKKSNGKYILFLDSDDLLEEISVKKLLYEIKKNHNQDYFFYKSRIVGEKKIDHNQIKLNSGKNFLDLIINKSKFRATCWNYLIKKNYLLNSKIFFKDARIFEDQFFVFQLLVNSNKFKIINKSIYKRRIQEPDTLSSLVGYQVNASCLNILKDFLRFIKRNNVSNKNLKEYLVSRINFLVNQFLINLTICNNSNLKNIFKKLSQLKLLDKEIQKDHKKKEIILPLKKLPFKRDNLHKYKQKKSSMVKKILNNNFNKKLIIFCAGSYGKISIKFLNNLGYKIDLILDNNKFFFNKKLESYHVKNLKFLKRRVNIYGKQNILVCNQDYSNYLNIKQLLLKIGIKRQFISHLKI